MASIGTSKASKKPGTESSRQKRASATPLNSLHRRGFLNPSERWLTVADGKAAAAMTQSGPCDPKGIFFFEKSLLHFSSESNGVLFYPNFFLSIDFQRQRKKHGSFCTWGLDHQGLGRVSWHDFEYLEKLCDTSSCAKANFEVYQAAGKWISRVPPYS